MRAGRLGAFLFTTLLAAGCDRPEKVRAVRTFVYALDRPAALEAGWGSSASDGEELLSFAERIVRRRFDVTRRGWWTTYRTDILAGRLTVTIEEQIHERAGLVIDGAIRSLGALEFLRVAEEADLVRLGTTLEAEREKLDAWRSQRAETPLAAFLRVPADAGGAHPRVAWFPARRGEVVLPLLLPEAFQESFGSGHIERFEPVVDDAGRPAIAHIFFPARAAELETFLERHAGARIAHCVRAEVLSVTSIDEAARRRGLLTSFDSAAQRDTELRRLQRLHGSLKRVH